MYQVLHVTYVTTKYKKNVKSQNLIRYSCEKIENWLVLPVATKTNANCLKLESNENQKTHPKVK